MKKLCLLMVFLIFCGFLVFGDTDEQEEVDFLLFLPNSSDEFVDTEQAMIQLDQVAVYLKNKRPAYGQIFIIGYAADVINDIEATDLSKDRALFVINELQKRGITRGLFAEPVGFGAVDFWGSNEDEGDRSPNRRVRILLEDNVITPAVVQAAEPVMEIQEIIQEEPIQNESASKFPWWIILIALLLIALIAALLFASKRKKPVQAVPVTVPVPAAPVEKVRILEEEEIRCHAYVLFERRCGQNGDDVGDWLLSIRELTDYYEAQGYRVILYWEVESA